MQEIIIQSSVIFLGIFFLTFLQKYYFKMLHFIANKSHSLLRQIVKFIIRFGIIIHEICHLIFGFIGGAKIQKIELFRPDGGRVTFATKNYIGHLGEYYNAPGYMFLLFFNQIGVFLTSLGPLLFGLIISYVYIKYFNISLELSTIKDISLSPSFILSSVVYIIIIPSFILSYQDIKHFFISKQESLGASIVGSVINTFIFICFLGFLTFFYEFFIIFGVLFIIMFLIVFFIWIIFYLVGKIGK